MIVTDISSTYWNPGVLVTMPIFKTLIFTNVCWLNKFVIIIFRFIPRVIGAIDCTFVEIELYKSFGERQAYYNYKKYNAVKLQVSGITTKP